ncbi:polysaccharide deacetylase family protein [uncultured Thiodictyon sp.]|uniref:polysaccharide deacetylase family protein n=1 Tax=uncultured Thiodictyon sp. TaxID=1846217 RepID=UPI0025CC0398|nr:polysaccharide deacetylase family protein [uncultured Thiodictyon sp.]
MQYVSLKAKAACWVRGAIGTGRRYEKEAMGAVILAYHGVVEDIQYPQLERYCVPRDVFRRHIRYLQRKHAVVPLAEILDAVRTHTAIDRRWVAITMDDGLHNQATIAAEILDEFSLPWAIAVPTRLIGGDRSIPTYELDYLLQFWTESSLSLPDGSAVAWHLLGAHQRQAVRAAIKRQLLTSVTSVMREAYLESLKATFGSERFRESFSRYGVFQLADWQQLRDLRRAGVELLAHGATHRPLNDTLTLSELLVEIDAPRRHFQEFMGFEPSGFILPHGIADARANEKIGEAGYLYCLTSRVGRVSAGADPFGLPRVDGEYTLEILRQHMARA